MDFLDDPSCFACGLCGQGARDTKETHALAMNYTTAFFRHHLLADPGALDYLTGKRVQADAATGAVTLQTK